MQHFFAAYPTINYLVQSGPCLINRTVRGSGPYRSKADYNYVGADYEEAEMKLQLLKNLNSIITRYAAFKYALCEAVQKENISVKMLLQHLYTLPVYNVSSPAKPNLDYLPHDIKCKLENTKSLEDIFTVLSTCDLFSFVNYGIYQSIFENFCYNSTNEDLKYAEHFQMYIDKHTVEEFVKFNPKLAKFSNEGSGSTMLIIKLDVDHMIKLSNIIHLKDCIAGMLGLHSSVLRIINIEEGCVNLTIHIPAQVAKEFFSIPPHPKPPHPKPPHPKPPHGGITVFTAHQIEILKKSSVMWLQCNGFTFDFRNNYLPVATVTSLPVSHALLCTSFHYHTGQKKVHLTFCAMIIIHTG